MDTGNRLLVPAIVAFELRRELLRLRRSRSIDLLDDFVTKQKGRYIELTDRQLKRAAELWANVRQRGRPTADPHALDIDVILAAQALSVRARSIGTVIIATSNVSHFQDLVMAKLWQDL